MPIKKDSRIHPIAVKLADEVKQKKFSRREFLFIAMSLGVSAATAKSLIGEKILDKIIPAANAEEPKRGGVLRISQYVKEISDPAIFDWSEKGNCGRQVVEHLLRITPDLEFVPWLMESWEVSDDAKTWTLHIRKDVKFNNGDELTAKDVVFNIKRWLDPEVGSSNQSRFISLTEEFDTGEKDDDDKPKMARREKPGSVEQVDDYTVRLNCSTADVAIAAGLGDYPAGIVHHKFTEWGGNLLDKPVGTGPFLLEDYQVGVKAVYKRRPDGEYWAGDPYLDGVEFYDYGDDPSAELSGYASQQVDLNYQTGADQVEAMAILPDITINEVETGNTGVARMNIKHKPFDNKKVRQAIMKAVDNQKVVDVAVQGRGTAAENHHVWQRHPDYAVLPPLTRDVEAAKALLKEAGYPNGIDLKLTCVNSPVWESDTCQAIVNQLKEANIRVKLDVRPSASYWDEWATRDFSFTSWNQRPLGIQVLSLAYRSGVPWNETAYSNPEFDKMLDEAGGITDAKERSKVVAKLEKMMQDDAIIIQSIWRKIYNASTAQVKNFTLHPNYEFHLEKVWLDS